MAEHTQIVLRSNCIFDGTGAEPFSGYVVIRDERILQVVQGDLPSELAHGSTVYELGNRTICPGFADAHTFFTGWALNYLGVDLSPATDSSQIGQIALTYANSLPPEKPVWGMAGTRPLSPADLRIWTVFFRTVPPCCLPQALRLSGSIALQFSGTALTTAPTAMRSSGD